MALGSVWPALVDVDEDDSPGLTASIIVPKSHNENIVIRIIFQSLILDFGLYDSASLKLQDYAQFLECGYPHERN